MSHTAAIVFRDGKSCFITVNDNELLLNAAIRQGVTLPVDCREGVCATCRGVCEAGQVSLDYVDEEALTEEELAEGHILACQTRLKSNGSFYFDVDSTLCNVPTQTFTGEVTALEQVSSAAATLELTLKDAKGLQYLPGQYARIKIPGTEHWRAYSFANVDPTRQTVRFLIRLLPSGVMSDYIRSQGKVGDQLTFEAPLGAFYLREIKRPIMMVAGGTGLSAFLAMLDALQQQGTMTQPVRLYYGVNHEADLSELARLNAFKTTLADFDYQTIVMHPTNEAVKKGVVCDLFEHTFLTQPFDAYLCGPPGMIEASKTWLHEHPVAEHEVYFEKFVSS